MAEFMSETPAIKLDPDQLAKLKAKLTPSFEERLRAAAKDYITDEPAPAKARPKQRKRQRQ